MSAVELPQRFDMNLLRQKRKVNLKSTMRQSCNKKLQLSLTVPIWILIKKMTHLWTHSPLKNLIKRISLQKKTRKLYPNKRNQEETEGTINSRKVQNLTADHSETQIIQILSTEGTSMVSRWASVRFRVIWEMLLFADKLLRLKNVRFEMKNQLSVSPLRILKIPLLWNFLWKMRNCRNFTQESKKEPL